MGETNGMPPDSAYVAQECVIYHHFLEVLIRENGPLTTEERDYLNDRGMVYDAEFDQFVWVPRSGAVNDLKAERQALVQAINLFLRDPGLMTKEEFRDELKHAVTFEEMMAEPGLNALTAVAPELKGAPS